MSERTNKFILDLSYAFALKIVTYAEELEKSRNYEEAEGLFKSGTSIGANIRDAQSAESQDGFIYHLMYAVKEAEETRRRLLDHRNSGKYPDVQDLINDISTMKEFINDILKSTKSSVESLKFKV
jgi:four helix bundle protein